MISARQRGPRFHVAWSYGVVVALFLVSWLVAGSALDTVRLNLSVVVNGEDRLSQTVDEITADMVNQETGLRGYFLTNRRQFLAPYWQGRGQLPRAVRQAQALASDGSERRRLGEMVAAAGIWEKWATSALRAHATLSQRRTYSDSTELTGKRYFDQFRGATVQMMEMLRQHRDARLTGGNRTFYIALILMSAITLGAILIVILLAHRAMRSAQYEHHMSERYRSLVESSPNGILLVNPEGKVLMANGEAAKLHGFGNADDLLGRHITELVVPDDAERAMDALRQRFSLTEPMGRNTEYRALRRDGTTFIAGVSSSILRDGTGRPEALTIVVHDVTAQVEASDALAHLALHDHLTDLPNRQLLHDRMEQALRVSVRSCAPLAFLLLDLDRFKEINDTFGHHIGDQFLQVLGPRLLPILRASDTLARLGGDEFALLLPGVDEQGAVRVAEKVLTALAPPVEIEEHHIEMRASMGIAIAPQHGEESAALLKHADVAMYAAKRAGGGYSIYDPSTDNHTPERLQLIQDMRHGLEKGQFILHYQPAVCLRSGIVRHVEALVRWRHPTRGMIAPGEFIPIAEQTGMIKGLTLWVLEEAITQCRIWQDAGMAISVAVNLSARSAQDPILVEKIAGLLAQLNVVPHRLVLELTESTIMDDVFRGQEILNRLHELGARISVDDFGTGYSSLAYLKRLPVDEIKIDKSFVLDMARDDNDRRIVQATIDLGHDLGLQTVAEGIETQESYQILRDLGCDLAQGYYVGRPMSAEACTAWLQQHLKDHSGEGIATGSTR